MDSESFPQQGQSPKCPVSMEVIKGDLTSMKLLLAEGTPTNLRDDNGWTALHHAVYLGREEFIKTLLEEENIDVNAVTHTYHTPLLLVFFSTISPEHKYCIIKLLLEAGADPHFDEQHSLDTLTFAMSLGYVPTVELLLKYGFNKGTFYESALTIFLTTPEPSLDMLNLILGEKPILDPQTPGVSNFICEFVAAFGNRPEILKTFLSYSECKKLINYRSHHGCLPLSVACSTNLIGAVNVLLDYGADPNLKNKLNSIAVSFLVAHDTEDVDESTLFRLLGLTNEDNLVGVQESLRGSFYHTFVQHPNRINLLLSVKQKMRTFDPNASLVDYKHCSKMDDFFNIYKFCNKKQREYYVSPLAYWCVKRDDAKDEAIFDLLLRHGGRINDVSNERIPPIIAAATCSSVTINIHNKNLIANYSLLEEEADVLANLFIPGGRINDVSNVRIPSIIAEGSCSPEHIVFHFKNLTAIYSLLEEGADVMIKMDENDPLPTVYIIAIHKLSSNCLNLLLMHSAPAQLIFTEEAFTAIKKYYQNERFRTCIRRNNFIYVLLHWLICVEKFLPQLPWNALQLQMALISEEEEEEDNDGDEERLLQLLLGPIVREFPEVSSKNKPVSLEQMLTDTLMKSMSTPKSLGYLAVFSIRRALWENNKSSILSKLVDDLCNNLGLPSAIRKMLNLEHICYELVNDLIFKAYPK